MNKQLDKAYASLVKEETELKERQVRLSKQIKDDQGMLAKVDAKIAEVQKLISGIKPLVVGEDGSEPVVQPTSRRSQSELASIRSRVVNALVTHPGEVTLDQIAEFTELSKQDVHQALTWHLKHTGQVRQVSRGVYVSEIAKE